VIGPCPLNPRATLDTHGLGVIARIAGYKIIDGHHRAAFARAIGLDAIPVDPTSGMRAALSRRSPSEHRDRDDRNDHAARARRAAMTQGRRKTTRREWRLER
jgi:hypothetical protein